MKLTQLRRSAFLPPALTDRWRGQATLRHIGHAPSKCEHQPGNPPTPSLPLSLNVMRRSGINQGIHPLNGRQPYAQHKRVQFETVLRAHFPTLFYERATLVNG